MAFQVEGKHFMLDDLLEVVLPWGTFAVLGALIGSAFPNETRKATKSVVRAALRASDWARVFGAEAYEKGQDIVAEARAEYDDAERESTRERFRVIEARPSRSRRSRTSAPARRRTRADGGARNSSAE